MAPVWDPPSGLGFIAAMILNCDENVVDSDEREFLTVLPSLGRMISIATRSAVPARSPRAWGCLRPCESSLTAGLKNACFLLAPDRGL